MTRHPSIQVLNGATYARGRALTVGELRSLPDGSVVWAHVVTYDGFAPGGRVCMANGPATIERVPSGNEWIVATTEFFVQPGEPAASACVDSYDEGRTCLYRAKERTRDA